MINQSKFCDARGAYLKANIAFREACSELERKYGATPSFNYSKADQNRLGRLRRAEDRASARMFRLLEASPRDWRAGVPSHWVCAHLPYADAARPKGERLSTVPPCAYGYASPVA